MAIIRTDFPHKIHEIDHGTITLTDGIKLAYRCWMPENSDKNPVPAILEYIPYCKRDGTAARDEAMHPYFARNGYAAIRVDMRGSGESEGQLHDEYLAQEQDDALEVISWISEQPWCNGNVGMMGKSWGGFNSLQVAARRPPALKCIISVFSTVDRYADDVHYMGGCMLIDNLTWAFVMFPAGARPPDPVLVGNKWHEMWKQRLECASPWLIPWVKHQRRDEYWQHGSVCEDFEAIQCPVYAIGGWADGYSNTVPHILENLSVPRKGLNGPWGHQYMHQANPGPKAGFLQEALRWWDYWLKDIDTGVMSEPQYRAYIQSSVPPQSQYDDRPGSWVTETSWPSPNTKPLLYTLNYNGLSEEPESPQPFSISTQQTVGMASPFWMNFGSGDPEEATDQRDDDANSLCFESAPLEQELSILGAPTLNLEIASDQPTAFVCARLCEVTPSGQSTLITFGVLNLTHLEGHDKVVPLSPGETYKVSVKLNDAGHTFSPGNRISLALSSAFWPMIWPSPTPVSLTVTTGSSTLELPTRDMPESDHDVPPLPQAEHNQVSPRTYLRQPKEAIVKTEQDRATGLVTFIHEMDEGKVRFDNNGWTFGTRTSRRNSIHPDDPTTAKIEINAVEEYGRENELDIRIEALQIMTCDDTNFYIKASLEAYEDGKSVFKRNWDETIARDGI